MKILILTAILLLTTVSLLHARPIQLIEQKADQPQPAQIKVVQNNDKPQFVAVDVFVDVKDKHLAAWQLNFSADNPQMKIVGIEGNQKLKVFRQPPYYDAKAIQKNHVILADFSTAPEKQLPTGKFKLATIHTQYAGQIPDWNTALVVATDHEGNKLPVTISTQTGE